MRTGVPPGPTATSASNKPYRSGCTSLPLIVNEPMPLRDQDPPDDLLRLDLAAHQHLALAPRRDQARLDQLDARLPAGRRTDVDDEADRHRLRTAEEVVEIGTRLGELLLLLRGRRARLPQHGDLALEPGDPLLPLPQALPQRADVLAATDVAGESLRAPVEGQRRARVAGDAETLLVEHRQVERQAVRLPSSTDFRYHAAAAW